MNKDFEKEYKKSAIDDTPDLWSRIEAGIDTKMDTAINTKKVIPFYKKYQGLLAACICLIVVIPAAIIGLRSNGQNKAVMESAIEKSAITDAAEESADMEAAPDTAAAEAESSCDINLADGAVQADSAESIEAFEAVKASKAPDDGMTLREVKLQITSASSDNYTAAIADDPNGYFQAGDTVSFTKDSYLKLDFESGSSYTVTMNYYADETIPYEVIKAVKAL